MTNRKINLIILLAIMGFFFSFSLAFGANIADNMKDSIGSSGISLPGGENSEEQAQVIVGKVIQAFLSIFGIIFMILMIYGGYKWMLASGREDEISKAKDIIKAAIIGLIIVMASYAISFFIASALQSAIIGE